MAQSSEVRLSRCWRRAFKKMMPVIFAGFALSIAGCVQPENPLLTDAKPLMGEAFEAHFYENFVDGKASSAHTAIYRWKDNHYFLARGSNERVSSFAGVALDNENFVVEGVSNERPGFSYWVARKLVDGVFQIVPVNETDADDAVRVTACTGKKVDGSCFVEEQDQLVKLAKATASKALRNPTLGVLILRREGA